MGLVFVVEGLTVDPGEGMPHSRGSVLQEGQGSKNTVGIASAKRNQVHSREIHARWAAEPIDRTWCDLEPYQETKDVQQL